MIWQSSLEIEELMHTIWHVRNEAWVFLLLIASMFLLSIMSAPSLPWRASDEAFDEATITKAKRDNLCGRPSHGTTCR